MDNEQLLLVVELFKNGLIRRATGKTMVDSEYVEARKTIIESPIISDILPQYVVTCRSADEFWTFIKSKFPTYKERSDYIVSDFNSILFRLEQSKSATLTNNETYMLGERIGDGGFGEVYKYHHTLLNIDFAVKILNPLFADTEKNDECKQRFLREAKMLFQLDHPNIVRFFDVGFINNKPFIRMELVDGMNMNKFSEKYSSVNFERSKKPIIALLEGLSHAHLKGIIHRDLKPSNFMVTQNGKFKIIDFGISAYVEMSGHTRITATGERVSGGLYTDPCLLENPQLRDVRSDIYSVGAIWYFLLTGRAPSGSEMREYLLKTAEISSLQSDIVLKCLSLDITKRYLTCDELISVLRPIVNQDIKSVNGRRITEVTRMDIFDFLIEFTQQQKDMYIRDFNDAEPEKVFYFHGRKSIIEFLRRVYKLSEMPSSVKNYSNFELEISGNIEQRKYVFDDWWVLHDDRLGLENGDDEVLLTFLTEMLHPAIRKEKSDWQNVLSTMNKLLKVDGYEIYEVTKISDRANFSFRSIV